MWGCRGGEREPTHWCMSAGYGFKGGKELLKRCGFPQTGRKGNSFKLPVKGVLLKSAGKKGPTEKFRVHPLLRPLGLPKKGLPNDRPKGKMKSCNWKPVSWGGVQTGTGGYKREKGGGIEGGGGLFDEFPVDPGQTVDHQKKKPSGTRSPVSFENETTRQTCSSWAQKVGGGKKGGSFTDKERSGPTIGLSAGSNPPPRKNPLLKKRKGKRPVGGGGEKKIHPAEGLADFGCGNLKAKALLKTNGGEGGLSPKGGERLLMGQSPQGPTGGLPTWECSSKVGTETIIKRPQGRSIGKGEIETLKKNSGGRAIG